MEHGLRRAEGMSRVSGAFMGVLLLATGGGAAPPEFGDFSSSTLTAKAWQAIDRREYRDAVVFAKKCIELYGKQAVEMQESRGEPVPGNLKEEVAKQWALNDAGTCLFILGQAYERLDKGTEALIAYRKLLSEMSFAHSWDTRGWYWMPADIAKMRVKMLEYDALR
jgi:hypothetical protein